MNRICTSSFESKSNKRRYKKGQVIDEKEWNTLTWFDKEHFSIVFEKEREGMEDQHSNELV